MHSDQIDVSLSLASGLIQSQFPQFRGEKIVALETAGTVNAIFRIGTTHVARLPLRMADSTECAKAQQAEIAAGAEFREHSPFPCPITIGTGQPTPEYPLPWMIQQWIPGEVATPTGLGTSTTFALDLGRLVTALRVADLKGRVFNGQGRGGCLPDHDGWMEVCFAKSEHLLDVPRLRSMWREMRALPPAEREVMSHKDLIPANILVRGEHLVGVLDTGSFGPADPSLDLVAGWHMLDRGSRAAFRSAVQADTLEWRRGAAWAFVQAMGLVWYYTDTNPSMSELGRSTLARLLSDDSSFV